jgi:hypothetical protein
MHDVIIQALQNQRTFLESPEMCYAVLSGGAEKYIQPRLGYELFTRSNGHIWTEVGISGRKVRIDFFGVINHARIAIEMGANALCNARTSANGREGVIKHMTEDTTKLFSKQVADTAYTLGVVYSMSRCDHDNHREFVKYKERYPLPIIDADRQARIKTITESKGYFAHPALGTVRRARFTTAHFDGYAIELLFFACGPFTKPLQPWW